MEAKLEVTLEEAVAIVNLLGSLPTSQGGYPLWQKLKAQVLGWVWANGVDKDATEAAVEGQIEAQKNPPIVSPPLPWVSP